MKPLLYGYMRVDPETPDSTVATHEEAFRLYAQAEGYTLASIYHEYERGVFAAFGELIEELIRTDARHVIVPDMTHVAAHQKLREQLLERLDASAQAVVISLGAER